MSATNNSIYVSAPQGWDDHAEEYHTMTIPMRAIPALKQLLSTANEARPFASATAILDNGYGSGHAMYALIEQYGASLPPDARVIASDYSHGMVAKVEDVKRENAASNQWWQKLETRVLNAEDLLAGLQADSLSHIISNLVFMQVVDYKAALRSSNNALAEGGVLALTCWLKIPWIEAWSHARAVAPDQEWDSRPAAAWRTPESIAAELAESGFKDVKYEVSRMKLAPDREGLRQMLAGVIKSKNPMAVKVWGKIPVDKAEDGIELILNGVERDYGGWPATMEAKQVIICGTK